MKNFLKHCIKVDISNYETKGHTKNVTHVDTLGFALKTNLAGLKTEVDKLIRY